MNMMNQKKEILTKLKNDLQESIGEKTLTILEENQLSNLNIMLFIDNYYYNKGLKIYQKYLITMFNSKASKPYSEYAGFMNRFRMTYSENEINTLLQNIPMSDKKVIKKIINKK